MDPPILTMKSVTNEKTEPEQARKRKTKTKNFLTLWMIEIFPPKSGWVTFYPLSMSNFMQKNKKIL